MPELPEVETVRRDLTKHLTGLQITRVEVIDGRVIRGVAPAAFARRLTGRVIEEVSRRGKAIICRLDDGHFFMIQLMMTGQMVYAPQSPASLLKETKVVFRLSNGSCLTYNDQRLFGRLTLVSRLEDVKHLNLLGPEPLGPSFNPEFMRASLKRRSIPIKTALMDHTFVAGIGNIYASEILFRSGVSPKRRAHRVKLEELSRVHAKTVEVLSEAIALRGSSMRNYRDGYGQKGTFNQRIKVYAREGEPCEGCQTPIVRIVQSGRSTFYCKRCQK